MSELSRSAEECEFETLESDEPVVVVSCSSKSSSARAGWERARRSLPRHIGLAPVLVDESDNPQYPTGRLVVRFHDAPSEADLIRFAEAHRLHVLEHNRWQPKQATFEPSQPAEVYLLDLVEAFRRREEVQDAWPEVRMRLQRGDAAESESQPHS